MLYVPTATREQMEDVVMQDEELLALFGYALHAYTTEQIRANLQMWVEAGDEFATFDK